MPRAGFEPARTVFKVNLGDLENFKLFERAKLNLGKVNVKHHTCRVKAFLKRRVRTLFQIDISISFKVGPHVIFCRNTIIPKELRC